MSYLLFLKHRDLHSSCRWVVKRNSKDQIIEVKLVYNPDEYKRGSKARRLYTQKQLIKVLDKEKQLKNQK